MEFRVRLVHAEGQRRVVLVQAFQAERFMGSALGEAASAEEAEDRAMNRLQQRLAPPSQKPTRPLSSPSSAPFEPPSQSAPIPEPAPSPSSGSSPPRVEEESRGSPTEPEDWSAGLNQVDQLLRHIGWGREEESVYVQRLFGHPNRSRLTRYADLMVLLQALERLPPGSDALTAPLPLSRSDLLAQCDSLLQHLGWSTEHARQCLEQQFVVTSRQLLTDEQLLAFNLLLEGEVLKLSPQAQEQANV